MKINCLIITFLFQGAVNIVSDGMIFVLPVVAVERHLTAVTAELESAKQTVLEWQTRFETSAALNTVDHNAALHVLRQELEDIHRVELENLTKSC